jgi:protein-L-isoaspartate(D-aspartate) O-methyltransferase
MNYEAAREIMVDSQIRPNDCSEPAVVAAFMRTPREAFVPSSRKSVAYSEMEIETSDNRSLWIPRDTAKLIKAADVKPSDIALVIGAGAGYEAALLSHLAETVIALEADAGLVEDMTERFLELGIDGAVAVEGQLADGLADQGPFDVIYICGMVQTLPDAWAAQLAEGGRLVYVMQTDRDLGNARVMTRSGEHASSRDVFDACPPRFAEFDRKSQFTF